MKLFKWMLTISLLLTLSAMCFGQTTAITATITDSDNTPWINASFTVGFVPNPSFPNINQYSINGVALTSNTYKAYLNQSGVTNGSAVLAITLLDNTQIQPAGSAWKFIVQSATIAQATSYAPISVVGTSQSLTSFLSSNAVPPRFSTSGSAFGYADIEVSPIPRPGGLYFNTTTLFTRQWNGTAWADLVAAAGVTSINTRGGPFLFTGNVDCTTVPGTCNFPSVAAGVVSINATTGAMIFNGAGVSQSGNTFTFPAAIASINGDTTSAQQIVGTGGITCSTAGGVTTCNSSGGAGTGTIGTSGPYNVTMYSSASGTTVQGAVNKYIAPLGLSLAQLNTLFSSVTGNITIQNGDNHTQFTNSNFVGVNDERQDIPVAAWPIKANGAQCDLEGGFASVTQGSTTLSITSGISLSSADVGKNIEMVAPVSGLPTRWDSTIVSVQSSSSATLISTSPAPFTESQWSVDIGHRDDAAINAAFDAFSFRRPISFPIGICWSDTVPVFGQSFFGQSSTESVLVGLAGKDTLAGLDPSFSGYEGMSTGMQIHDLKVEFDPRINAIFPWQDINPAGTVTQHAGTYRPEGLFTVWANYPLGPGWFQGAGPNNTGAINGVATTDGTVNVTITSSTLPLAGQQIIFPYTSAGVFTTTVSSISGSAAVLANAFPVSGTLTQQEWFAGTSVQTITQSNASGSFASGIPATGRTFPFILRLANNINPPPTPNPAGTGSNFAPYGLVQIDNEQCSYFGDSAYPATTSTTYWIQITACAQNGTTAAAHALGATIVPLNPFQPTWPWPVTPSINAGVTPANAVYFPAWNIGNAAWAQPVFNGEDWPSNGDLVNSVMHDMIYTITDFFAGNGGGVEGGPAGFQLGNSTAGMYIVTSTFNAKFYNIQVINPQFGIFEGTPSTNVFGMFGSSFPTANGSSWDQITIHSAGYVSEFIEAQNDMKTNFQTFCQNGGETGTSNPNQGLGIVGCGATWIDSGTYDDKDGGGGSDVNINHKDNWYQENETGSLAGSQPAFEFNCGRCSYGKAFSFGGEAIFIEGGDNEFDGGQLVAGSATPIINYGTATTMKFVSNASFSGVNNTYGSSFLLNYGQNGSMSGHTDNGVGPFGALAAGNNLAPVTGQTAQMFSTGNDLGGPEYVSGDSAVLFADQLPMQNWIFDDTAPVSHGYASCDLSPGQGCSSVQFNQNSRVVIGPDQKIAPGKYIVHYAFKGTVATNFFFELDAVNGGTGACSGGGTILIVNPSITTGWTQGSALADFTNASTCDLQLVLHNSAVDTVAEMAYLIFTPIWTTAPLPVNTPADNATCIPGSFLGSDSNFLYICTASGTVKRAAISSY
jgi:hypothetical protein